MQDKLIEAENETIEGQSSKQNNQRVEAAQEDREAEEEIKAIDGLLSRLLKKSQEP